MSRIESFLLAYLLNSLWQVPLAFTAAVLAARLLRPAGVHVQHRAWACALCAGPLLPALSMLPFDRFHVTWIFVRALHTNAEGQVSIQLVSGTGFAAAWLPPLLLHSLAAGYCALIVWFTLRFAWRYMRVRSLVRESTRLTLDPQQQLSCRTWSERLSLGTVLIAKSSRVFAPVAVGVHRKIVLFPTAFAGHLAPPDFDMVIAHEFAHVQRNDFLKNLCYEIVALPVSYHPILWLIRQRLAETREMVCDEMAAQVSGTTAYVQSLLRLASLLVRGFAHPLPHGIGVFDADTLERRLMKLTLNSPRIGHVRRAVLVVLSILLATGAAASALALRLSLDPAAISAASSSTPAPRTIPPDVLQRNVLTKVSPIYPPDAKTAHIQGTVALDAIIGKTGDVENLKVLSGPEELQQSALDAVRQWKYKPFVLNGRPTEVRSTIKITYSLQK